MELHFMDKFVNSKFFKLTIIAILYVSTYIIVKVVMEGMLEFDRYDLLFVFSTLIGVLVFAANSKVR
jgi:hypothetical protein